MAKIVKRRRTIISQREARRLRKQVSELQLKLDGYKNKVGLTWPGVHLGTIRKGEYIDHTELTMVRVARRLGHITVVVPSEDETALFFYGIK